MTIFGQGEPTQVAIGELALLRALAILHRTRPNWVKLFIGRCIPIQSSPTGKFSLGGFITLLINHLGVDVPEHCAVLHTTASFYYDFATLHRPKF